MSAADQNVRPGVDEVAAEQTVDGAPESGSWFLGCCGSKRNDGTTSVTTAAAKAKEDATAAKANKQGSK